MCHRAEINWMLRNYTVRINNCCFQNYVSIFWSFCETVQKYVCDVSGTLWHSVTIYYGNNTTYINQQLLKVEIVATCFSYSEPSSGQKRNPVLVHSVIVHSMGSLNVPEIGSVFGLMMAHCS